MASREMRAIWDFKEGLLFYPSARFHSVMMLSYKRMCAEKEYV